MKNSVLIRGMASAFAGALLWGFSGTCMQYLLERYEISSLFITMARDLGAGVLFVILFAARYRTQCATILRDWRSLRELAILGCLGLFFCQLTYVLAIEYTNAGTATVLQCLNVIIILVITCVRAPRAPRPTELLAICSALAATVLIATKGEIGTLHITKLGLFWGLVSAGTAAFYTLYPRKLFGRMGSMPVTGFGIIGAAISASVVWVGQGFLFATTGGSVGEPAVLPALGPYGVVILALIACIGTFLTFALFLHGVSLIGGVRGSLLGTAEPVSATVFSAVWIGTQFVWADWAGLVLMIATVALVALQPNSQA